MDVVDDLAGGNVGELRLRWPREEQEVFDDLFQPVDLRLNHGHVFLFGVTIRKRLFQAEQSKLDGRERVSDLVCDTSREHPERSEFLLALHDGPRLAELQAQ